MTLIVAACSAATGLRAKTAPSIEVTGPVPVTAASHPFLAADHQRQPLDLAAAGYLEEEYFVAGKANVYEYDSQRALKVRTADATYTTRIIVRRPKDVGRFNGNVVVELLNPSHKVDVSVIWGMSHDYLLAQGYAYVAITSKPVAIAQLKTIDPDRYQSLGWPNPLPPDQTCASPGYSNILPGDSTVASEDGLIWDIFTQVGTWLKSRRPDNPLSHYRVINLFAVGYSQTGAYIGTYAQDFAARARLPNGKPIYDGFIQGGSSGLAKINQCAQSLGYEDPHTLIRSSIPLIRIVSLSDFYTFEPFKPYLVRRADSDAPNDQFRLYEVAGASHTQTYLRAFDASDADMAKTGLTIREYRCKEPVEGDFPLGLIFNSALRNLDLWVRKGVPAPHAARLEVTAPGSPEATPVVDSFGNAKGGVRTPYVDVPIAAYYGTSTPPDPKTWTGGCLIEGHKIPFTPSQLRHLYPTHSDYVGKVRQSVEQLVRERWLTPYDGVKIEQQAARSEVP